MENFQINSREFFKNAPRCNGFTAIEPVQPCPKIRDDTVNQVPAIDLLPVPTWFLQPGFFSPGFEPSGSSFRYLTWRASSKFHSSAIRRFSRNFWMAYLTVRGDSPVSVIISLFVKALPTLSNESTIHEEGGSFIRSSPWNTPGYGTCGIPVATAVLYEY